MHPVSKHVAHVGALQREGVVAADITIQAEKSFAYG